MNVLCSNNQFRLGAENADDLDIVFEERLRSAGWVIAMLDTWDNSVYLTRCWTIFEQYIGAKLGIKITIILPPEGMASFTEQMENGNIKQIKASLTTFDVADAKASVPEDEVKVKGLISSTVGFDAVNKSVRRSMQTWCASVLKAYLDGCIDMLKDDDPDSNMNMGGEVAGKGWRERVQANEKRCEREALTAKKYDENSRDALAERGWLKTSPNANVDVSKGDVPSFTMHDKH